MTDDITCDVCTASSDWVCRRCYDALELKVQLLERALADVCKAAAELTSWDFSHLLVDHHDSQTLLNDVSALEAVLRHNRGGQP